MQIIFLLSNKNDIYHTNIKLGRVGGGQTFTLTSDMTKMKVIHELSHAFGFDHEQNRPG